MSQKHKSGPSAFNHTQKVEFELFVVTSVKYTSALGKMKTAISQGPLVERYRILPVCLRAPP